MKKLILFIILFCFIIGAWFLYSEIYTSQAQYSERVSFTVNDDIASSLAYRLEQEHVIRHAWLFNKYVVWKGIDRDIRPGNYEVTAPITLARVVAALANPSENERTITIIPGWDLRDIADYFVAQGMFSADELYMLTGKPARDYRNVAERSPVIDLELEILKDKPNYVSYEGYIAPDTYRVFTDASLEDILKKLIKERDTQFTEEMYADIASSGRSVYEVLTMASILEREVRGKKDKALVSDLFWRRYDMNWALQADSTVHYLTGKAGDVFTTAEDRESLSPWNTYKYPGLPLGPICNPSLESIMAAIYPEENNYWYFLTDSDGVVHYAKDLDGHNANVNRYLR